MSSLLLTFNEMFKMKKKYSVKKVKLALFGCQLVCIFDRSHLEKSLKDSQEQVADLRRRLQEVSALIDWSPLCF